MYASAAALMFLSATPAMGYLHQAIKSAHLVTT